MSNRTFVIVGASLAGAKAAEQLRAEGFTGRVILVGADSRPPYERPPLSKGYLLGTDELDQAFVHDIGWYGDHDIELILGTRATAIDRGAPLAQVLHAQALDARDDAKRDLIERAGRKEIYMLLPARAACI